MTFHARCILELHAISSKISDGSGRFEITMPAHSRQSFLSATSADQSKYFSLLSNVAAEQSVCSRNTDKDSIHKAVRDSIGFDGLNRSIYSVMTNWIIDQIQAFSRNIKDSNPLAFVQRMKALGTILCEMGRYDEALHVYREASRSYLSFQNISPLAFGTDVNSVDCQIDRQIIRIHVHLGQYDLAQQLYDEIMKRNAETVNRRLFHTFGLDMGAIATHIKQTEEPDAIADSFKDAHDQLIYYHRLVFSDADDPEFLEACGCCSFNFGELQAALNDPHLNLKLKKTAFQLKINRLPAKHSWIASAMLRLAHAHFEVDQLEEALPLLHRALPFLRRLPRCHPNIILALLLVSACTVKRKALSQAAAAAEEALTLCQTAGGKQPGAIAIPVEFESSAREAVFLCRDADFQMNLISHISDVSDGCVGRFVAIIKTIGSDEARMERAIINRGRDAADNMLSRIMPRVQALMDERMRAEGRPAVDV
jgi:tetratricopeptide (TPR) repeat protein